MTPDGPLHGSRIPFGWSVRGMFALCIALSYAAYSCGLVWPGYAGEAPRATCRWLLVNTFLAYIPVELALHFGRRTNAAAFWMLFAAWALFYPNAPYMLTDYFHLSMADPYIVLESGRRVSRLRSDANVWAIFSLLSACIITATLFGTWSLDRAARALGERLRLRGRAWVPAIVAFFAVLSAAGIYLGRFPRLHTVHLFMRPVRAFSGIAGVDGSNAAVFIALVAPLQFMLWCCLRLAAFRPRGADAED